MADTLSFTAKVDLVNFWVSIIIQINDSQNWPSKMRSGIVHHKSDRKPCVIPTADRNNTIKEPKNINWIPIAHCLYLFWENFGSFWVNPQVVPLVIMLVDVYSCNHHKFSMKIACQTQVPRAHENLVNLAWDFKHSIHRIDSNNRY